MEDPGTQLTLDDVLFMEENIEIIESSDSFSEEDFGGEDCGGHDYLAYP